MHATSTESTTHRSNLEPPTPGGRGIAGDVRSARILAASIYRELRSSGLDERDVLAIATSMVGLSAEELREHRGPEGHT